MIDNASYKTIRKDTKISSQIPGQVKSAEEAAMILRASETADYSTKTVLITAFVINTAISASVDEIWGTINSLQMISLQNEFNLYSPSNSQVFFKFVTDLSELEIIPNEWVEQHLFFFLKDLEEEEESTKDQTRALQDSEQEIPEERKGQDIVSRVGGIMLVGIALLLLIPILVFLSIFAKCTHQASRWYHYIYYSLFWNQTIRYILESYVPTTMLNFNRIFRIGLKWTNTLQTVLSLITIVTFVFYLIVPLYMTIYFRRNVHQFGKQSFKQRFIEAIFKLDPKSRSSANYFSIFCYRRLFTGFLIVLMPTHSSSQIMLYSLLNQTVLIALGASQPFKKAGDLRTEFFNEAFMLITGYHLFLLTDFVPNPETRYLVGTSLVLCTSANVIINLSIVLYTPLSKVFRQLNHRYRRQKLRRKRNNFRNAIVAGEKKIQKKIEAEIKKVIQQMKTTKVTGNPNALKYGQKQWAVEEPIPEVRESLEDDFGQSYDIMLQNALAPQDNTNHEVKTDREQPLQTPESASLSQLEISDEKEEQKQEPDLPKVNNQQKYELGIQQIKMLREMKTQVQLTSEKKDLALRQRIISANNDRLEKMVNEMNQSKKE